MKALLNEIFYVWFYQWPPNHSTASISPPGHTIHYMVEGEYMLTLNHKTESVRKGDLVYYAGNEPLHYHGGSQPVVMYSVNFSFPNVPVLSGNRRIFQFSENFTEIFKTLYLSFHQTDNTPLSLEAFAGLNGILRKMYEREAVPFPNNGAAQWKEIEILIRTERKFRIKPSELSSHLGISSSTLYRMCLRETGKSPEKKIKEIRMNEAKKMLRYSGLNISGIAAYLGFPRIHEFSREFSEETKQSPSDFKKEKESRPGTDLGNNL